MIVLLSCPFLSQLEDPKIEGLNSSLFWGHKGSWDGTSLPRQNSFSSKSYPYLIYISLSHVVAQVVGACFRVFRVVLVHLRYIVLLWRMMLRALPCCSEHCSGNSWKLLCLSLLDSHQFFKVTTQHFSFFDCCWYVFAALKFFPHLSFI